MIKYAVQTFLVISFLFCSPQLTYAQNASSSQKRITSNKKTWLNVRWEKRNEVYRQARLDIDAQIKKGVSINKLIKKLDQPYNLNSTLAQFKWGYAYYQAARKTNFRGRALQEIKERLLFGADQNPPPSQEFARLLFLVYSRIAPFENLADVGQRLVKQYPNDFEVKWFALQCLNPGVHPSHLPVAIAYANDLKKQQPKKPESIYLFVHIYEKLWYSTWERRDSQKIINEYRKIMKAYPNDKGIRAYAEKKIKWVQKVQPNLDRNISKRPQRNKW